ncbi:FAD-dependent oxidoreductase [Streptomyces sp. NPDC057148]|uniref:FAD-dependent oxidoreductase n=1 Tax=unclassified Streptomyces TaxID=2593676 RepID=UPI00364240A5
MARALVIGAGIAGTVAAIALQKAGLEPVLYEAYDRTADGIGNFVNIAPNGIDALDSIDVGHLVREHGFDTPAIAFYSHTGRPLTGDVRTDRLAADGQIIQTIRRSDLYMALRDEAAKRGIPIEYGKRIVDATTEHGTVRAVFADETHAEGDLLVGADGLRSRVRRVIDPAAPVPRYLGVLNAFGCARGFPTDGPAGVIRMFFGKKSFFSYTKHPNGDLWWFANPPCTGEPDSAQLRALRQDWRRYLQDLFAADRSPAAEIIAATPDPAPPSPTYDLPRVPRWHRDGGLVVIGDAAHAVSPTAGQGCSVAMEDAVVLAKCLRDAPSTDQAFVTYESVRRKRVEDIVAQGKYNNEGNMRRGPIGRSLRNYFIARAFKSADGSDPTWMSSHHIDWHAPQTEESTR